MRRPGAWLALLFLLSFGIGLLPQLPLRFALRFLPGAMACTQPEGAALSGQCQALTLSTASGPVTLGTVSWTWRPWRMLRARLAFDVSMQRGPTEATALVQFTWGRVELLEVNAKGPIDALLSHGAPPGWTGQLDVRGLRLRLQKGQITALDGDLTVKALRSAQGVEWGSYRLHIPRLPGGGLAPGALESVDGPLLLRGTLLLKADRTWQLDAQVAAKPGAPEGAASALSLLGPPDAAGMRPLSIAGSY